MTTVLALAAGVVAHPTPLTSLGLEDAQFDNVAVLDAVVAAVLARRVRCAWFDQTGLTPACAPAVARLLGGDALQELGWACGENDHLLDEPAAALLGAALLANTTLTTLTLDNVISHDAAAAVVLLRSLKAHPSLRTLGITNTRFADDGHVTFAALGELVAANAPALTELDVCECNLGDEGLGLLVDALAANTHLRVLNCSENGMSSAFAHDRLPTAVRANNGLRQLTTAMSDNMVSDRMAFDALSEEEILTQNFLAEVDALVAARCNGDAS
jgi:hypothetical protein